MSNELLLNSIKTACAKFENKELSLMGLQSSIEANGQALEGKPREVYAQLHDFCNDLEKLEFACLAEKQYEEGLKVVKRLKGFLAGLT